MMRRLAFILLVSALQARAEAPVDTPPPLAHNPFSRPSLQLPVTSGLAPDLGRLPAAALEVQATLVGAGKRYATVDGRVIAEGDDVAGYRLVQVFEDRAVFARNGERRVVYVRKIETDEHE